jgi:hypothetical protein
MVGYQIGHPYREQRDALTERYLATSDEDERRRIRQDLLKLPLSCDGDWRFEPDPPTKDELALDEICPQPLVGDFVAEIVPKSARAILTPKGLLVGTLVLRATSERSKTHERRLRFLLRPSSSRAEPLTRKDLSSLVMWRHAVGAERARCFVELVEGLRVASLGKRVRFELRERRGWRGLPETCVMAVHAEDGDASR